MARPEVNFQNLRRPMTQSQPQLSSSSSSNPPAAAGGNLLQQLHPAAAVKAVTAVGSKQQQQHPLLVGKVVARGPGMSSSADKIVQLSFHEQVKNSAHHRMLLPSQQACSVTPKYSVIFFVTSKTKFYKLPAAR